MSGNLYICTFIDDVIRRFLCLITKGSWIDFGWNRINRAIKEYGREEALRRIREAEKYASGLAYAKNVEQLAGFIQDAGAKYDSQALMKLAQDVMENAYAIRDEWIYPAYEALYKLNDGVPPEQVASNVRTILRLKNAS